MLRSKRLSYTLGEKNPLNGIPRDAMGTTEVLII